MKKASLRGLALGASLFCMPTGASLFRVYVHQDAVQLGYALSAAERLRDGLHGRAQRLQVELAAQRSPSQLAQVARRLGLRPPSVGQVVSGHSSPAHLARAEVRRARHARR